MSSCTNTFRNLLPLCTSKVCPTNSGMIVHERAQVFTGCLARFSFSLEIRRKSFSSTYGPFFALLLIAHQFLVVSCWLLVGRLRATGNQQLCSHIHRLRSLLMLAELAPTQNQLLTGLPGAAGL